MTLSEPSGSCRRQRKLFRETVCCLLGETFLYVKRSVIWRKLALRRRWRNHLVNCCCTPSLKSSNLQTCLNFIGNCIVNTFLSFTAIMLNIATIHAIRKTSSLPKTLKALLLSLAVSDLGVGLCVQPFYTSLLIKWLQHNIPSCITYKVFALFATLLSAASFFGVVAVGVDRFLAIHLHLRYQELVTHKRVLAVTIFTWGLSAFVSLTSLWVSLATRALFLGITATVGFLLTMVVYIRIYVAVRRHKNHMQVLQVRQVTQTDEMANFAGIIKTAVGVFYLYLVFLFCYLPYFISFAALKIFGPSDVLRRLYFFSCTLVYLNSSLNPVIYCWKVKHIRHAIMDILRNIINWLRNPSSCAVIVESAML